MSTGIKIALVVLLAVAGYLFWKKQKEQQANPLEETTASTPSKPINGGLSEAELRLQIDQDPAANWKADKALKLGLYVPGDANTRGLPIINILRWMFTIKYQSPKYWASIQTQAAKKNIDAMTQLANAASYERLKQLEKEAGKK